MKFRNTLLSFFIVLMAFALQAQDRHFTLYNFSPINLNPALTGAYEGTVRLGGIYRAQGIFSDFTGGNAPTFEYSTPSFYADAPLLTVRKRDWISAGIDFYKDQSGTIKYGDQWFKLAAAYHLSLDKKRNSIFTAGVRWGTVTRSYDSALADLAVAEPNIAGGVSNPNKTGFKDWGGGLMLRSKLNKTMKLELGVAADHVLTPGDNRNDRINTGGGNTGGGTGNTNNPVGQGVNFITNQDTSFMNPNPSTLIRVPLPFTWTAHGKFDVQLNDNLSFSPSFLFQTTRGSGPETVLQVPFGFHFDKESNQVVHAGLGYRVGDALQILAGYDFKNVRVGLSYDLTLSSLKEITSGGFEIAAAYIIKVYKQPKVEPAILCPRF